MDIQEVRGRCYHNPDECRYAKGFNLTLWELVKTTAVKILKAANDFFIQPHVQTLKHIKAHWINGEKGKAVKDAALYATIVGTAVAVAAVSHGLGAPLAICLMDIMISHSIFKSWQKDLFGHKEI